MICPFLLGNIGAQPQATIESSPIGICSQSPVSVDILLEGTAPFRIQYMIYYQSKPSQPVSYTTGLLYPDLDKKHTLTHSLGEDNDDIAVIQLLKIRDKTLPDDQWIDIQSQSINFPIFKKPVPSVTLSDNHCGYTTTLTARDNGLKDQSYSWQALGGGTVAPSTGLSTTFSVDDAGNYSVIFTERNGTCEVTHQTDLQLWGFPKGNITGSTVICTDPANTDTKQITIDVALSGNSPFQYTLSNGTKRSVNGLNDHFILQPEVGGDIVIASISDVNGCVARPQDRTGTAVVTDRKPTPHAGPDINVCSNEAVLNASPVKSGNSGSWSFANTNDGEFLSASSSEMATIRTNRNGKVTMRWTETNTDGSACSAHDDTDVFFDLPVESAYAGPDTILYLQNRYIMKAVMKPWETGQWSIIGGDGTIVNPDDPFSPVESLTLGSHTFRWTVGNGICPELHDEVEIEIRNLKWPDAFSPNGDGVNDCLEILGAPFVPNNELIVYDLRGRIVYRKANYDNTWDGKDMGGKEIVDGYYYYIFKGENIPAIKESLIIKRSKN
jgi:gliding motility-associated-like protein